MASSLNLTPITLGPHAAAVKRRVSSSRWKSLVKRAHKAGFTIDSFLDPSTPRPLKERTPSSLTKQAYNTVAKAYAPGEQQLDQRSQDIKAISDKRALDNQFYLNWLSARHAQLATHAQAAEQQLIAAAGGIQNQTMQDYGAVQQRLKDTAAQQPGNVSNPEQATAFNLTPEAKRAVDLAGVQANQTLDRVSLNDKAIADGEANNFAFMAAQEAKRVADTWQQLHDVADDRMKLELARGQDAAKEISRLLDNEITKANANRDYAAAASRLGIQQQNADTAVGRLALGNKSLKHKTAVDQANLKIKRGQLKVSQDRITLGWYNAKHPHRKAGQVGGNASDPQSRFEYGYALLGSSTRDVTTKGGKTKSVRIDSHYVGKNENEVIAKVQAAAKVSRKMATLIVRAYMLHDGADPGQYGQYFAPGVGISGY